MTQTIQINMTGQMPNAPYQSVFWTVYGEPDPTGALSGYGANYLINIGVDTITINGAAVDPVSLTVGGDLFGTLPNPIVVGLQSRPIASTAPTTGQILQWSGTQWTPGSVTAIITSIDVPASATFQITQDAQTSNLATHDMTIRTQAPFASAPGSLRLPGNFNITIPSAAGALAATTSGNIDFNFSGHSTMTFYSTPSTNQGFLEFLGASGGQILGCVAVVSTAALDLDAGASSVTSFKFGGVSFFEMSKSSPTQGYLNLQSDCSIEAGILRIASTDDTMTLIASGVMTVQGNSIVLDSFDSIDIGSNGACGILGTPLNLSSTQDITLASDANTIVNASGDLDLNSLGGNLTLDCSSGSLTLTGYDKTRLNAGIIVMDGNSATVGFVGNNNLTVGGTGYDFKITGSSDTTTSGTGGLIQLTPGSGATTHHGNVALFSTPSSAAGTAGGSYTLWLGDRATAPGTNPSGGTIVYSESGVLKVRSVGNTVTLGNKPSVTGSKASGAALLSLLTILDTAGLITNNTTA